MKNEDRVVNYLRVTGCNMITNAKSGHPGIVLSGAPILYSIYKNAMINNSDSNFFNRDRIVVSAGHGSALYYATLNLFGYDIDANDLKNFRKYGSNTPGHPEVHITDGVDCSTGPLGQGIANAVGFAIAESYLSARYNQSDCNLIDHYTYCFSGDGCLMEGVALEAISLAGHLKLNKLIVLYDYNQITIEGKLGLANSEDVRKKFEAQGWNVLEVKDGNSVDEIDVAISLAKGSRNKPTLIIVNTVIGYGSELAGNCKCHGNPFKPEEVESIKNTLGYLEEDWTIPSDVQKIIDKVNKAKIKDYKTYQKLLEKYKTKYHSDYIELRDAVDGRKYDVLSLVNANLHKFSDNQSTREINSIVLNAVSKYAPFIIGGTADLSSSTKVVLKEEEVYSPTNRAGKNIYFGIREHSMGAICNGISLHGGLLPFCGTYLAFENYMAPAVHMSALMPTPVIFTFTHDSIQVGEDGPSHQPIEQIATLRAMPNLRTFRPCNYEETFVAYDVALNTRYPTAIVCTRQNINRVAGSLAGAKRGAYFVKEEKAPKVTILASGSEVELAVKVANILDQKGCASNVVSCPCLELFDDQNKEYKDKILAKNTAIFAIEASSDNVWYKYISNAENLFNITEFGRSGNAETVYKNMGFSDIKISNKILKQLGK